MGNTQLMSDMMSNSDMAIIAYHVEERINMPFGSSITTYEVSSESLISTTNLGENNTRVVTPKYGKAKIKAVAISLKPEQAKVQIVMPEVSPAKIEIARTVEKVKSVNIDILGTYERVLDKGYKSIDMLKRVGNGRYFDGDLVMAAKWYDQLFALTTDLEAEYFFRYAQSLKSVSQDNKANEMMAIWESKNATSN
ncbi:hypothetical protein [Flavobacterium sp.]|uniref:hypothetical protein n=1 Tax=Flavobacterium sp. TaxID=239 RepID=UPI0039E3EDFB